MPDRPKIVLDENDFAEQTASTGATVPIPPPAAANETSQSSPNIRLPAVTRGVPRRVEAAAAPGVAHTPPSGTAANWLTSPAKAPLVAAGIGVILAWAVTELFGLPEIGFHTKTGSDAVTALWTGAVGLVFGGIILAFDSAVAGAWDVAGKRFMFAAAPMFAASFAGGWIANFVYLKIAQDAVEHELQSGSLTKNNAELYLARGLGWALFGIGVGVTAGLLTRSRKRAVNGALGGALGGAAGGLVFEFVADNMEAGVSTSRLLGLVAIGGLIALATRAIETARREAWLKVLSGGMAGKEFILYHTVTRLGSTPECEIFLLKDASIAKVHAQIEDRGTQRVVAAMPGVRVFVNQTPVDTQVLRNGDQVQLGNTVLGYSERAIATSSPYA
jgi:Inner membrane component of T3SS, cytoplasmic domain